MHKYKYVLKYSHFLLIPSRLFNAQIVSSDYGGINLQEHTDSLL